uniref:glycoside hydrolase family 20 zincin-like fold domain-containing protein n=1 Tax=Algoriphagus sp. TaxID=1872435 RepID=UPI0040489907
MKNLLWTSFVSVLFILSSCQKPAQLSEKGLIPLPKSIENGKGIFELNAESGIKLIGSSERMTLLGESLASRLRPATGFDLPVSKDQGNIVLELGQSGNLEAYELLIADKEIRITSAGEAGLFYGIQSLIQLFPVEIEQGTVQKVAWVIPQGEIVDSPEFTYRGSMLDVARHFLPKEDVLFYLDQMASLK